LYKGEKGVVASRESTRSLCKDRWTRRITFFDTGLCARETRALDSEDVERNYAAHYEFAYLKRKVPPDAAERAARPGMPILFTQNAFRHAYLEGEVAAQTSSFTGSDGDGLEGIERLDEPQLRADCRKS
jgi:hypothetical protein